MLPEGALELKRNARKAAFGRSGHTENAGGRRGFPVVFWRMEVRVVRRAYLACVVVAAALPARPVAACGGGGVTTTVITDSSKAAVADSQRIVLALHDAGLASARTEIIAQIGVPGADSDFGVVIPVPGRPEIDPEPVSMKDLDALDRYTKPTIITTHVVDTDSGGGEGFGCGCASAGDDDSSSKGETAGTPATVSVSAPVNVGPATAVVLESDDGSALTAWLDENGFAIPAEQQAIVDHYVELGDAFIAIRRNDSAPPDGPTSLGLHYTLRGDHRQLSFMFARIGAAPTVAFTVFVTAPTVAFPAAPYAAVQLSALSDSTLRTDYSAAVAEAVAARNSQAFVIEGTYGAPTGATLSPAFRELLGIDTATGNITTRASTIVAGDTLSTDARLDIQGFPVSNSVTLEPSAVRRPNARESSVGVLSLVLAARALRRRFRRRGNSAPAGPPGRALR